MADHVTLLGAEDVAQAARTMRAAADEMQRAAIAISEAMQAQQRFLDDWLTRLDGTLADRTHDLGQAMR
jgi:hypothetical protein